MRSARDRVLALGIAAAALVAAIFLLTRWLHERDDSALDAMSPKGATLTEAGRGRELTLPRSETPPVRAERSTLADTLNAEATTGDDDVRVVRAIFENYLTAMREVPSGSNAEIVRVLSGGNSRGHAPLPLDSPAINAKGELCDRWGRPYFFHNETRTRVTIRSRGPDGELFTADDSVSASGHP
jgi:hypothetical protein